MSKKYRNSVIVDEEKIIKKKKDNSVSELFNYLDSRGFNSHPEIILPDKMRMLYLRILRERVARFTRV